MDLLLETRKNNGKEIRLPKNRFEWMAYNSIKGKLPNRNNLPIRILLKRRGLDFNELEVHRFITEVQKIPSLEQMYNFYVNLVLLLNKDINLVGHKDKMFTIILGTKFIDDSGEVNMDNLEQALIALESYRIMQSFTPFHEG